MQPFRKLGPYELVERLAVGGMAEIYIARSRGVQGFEKDYVLKLIHPKYVGDSEFIRMLVDEAKLVGALTHPNVAQVIDLGADGDAYYILMEYVRGKDLYQVLNQAWDLGFNLPIPMCVHIAKEMCAALYYAHHKADETGRPLNIVHRDISPQNVLVSFNGEAKIVDFGVAKAALGARPETRAGIIKGKFRYMSPEQAWGEKLDGRSDLFSAALCLYEMVCGETAYPDDGDMQKMLTRMREAKFTPPTEHRPEVDAELQSIIMKALERDRNDRYPTCHAFEVALANYLHRHFPGYTPVDITAVMKEMYPDETSAMHTPEPTEKTSALDSVDIGTDELEALGFKEIADDADTGETFATGDRTLRASILRGQAAEPAPDPESLSQDDTGFFNHDEEPTMLDLGPDARAVKENIGAYLGEEEKTMDLPSYRRRHDTNPPPQVGPPQPGPPQRTRLPTLPAPPQQDRFGRDGPNPHRRTLNPRRDTVADLIEKHLPPSAADHALRFHRRLAEILESDDGSNVLMVVLGVTLGLFMLLVIVLIAF